MGVRETANMQLIFSIAGGLLAQKLVKDRSKIACLKDVLRTVLPNAPDKDNLRDFLPSALFDDEAGIAFLRDILFVCQNFVRAKGARAEDKELEVLAHCFEAYCFKLSGDVEKGGG